MEQTLKAISAEAVEYEKLVERYESQRALEKRLITEVKKIREIQNETETKIKASQAKVKALYLKMGQHDAQWAKAWAAMMEINWPVAEIGEMAQVDRKDFPDVSRERVVVGLQKFCPLVYLVDHESDSSDWTVRVCVTGLPQVRKLIASFA